MPLVDEIATADGKRRYVRALFATIADRYDFITVALSYGQDRRWKRRLTDLAQPRSGQLVLDLATGTGDIAFALAARGARVVGLDVTPRMIALALAKNAGHRPVRFVVGDMIALPFPSASFDAVTIGYGLRNVPDLAAAIAEASRVLKAGGRLVSLDFNRPANRAIRSLYLRYLTVVGGLLGWLLHRDPDTYRYIPASLRTYPGAKGISGMLEARGFLRVEHQPVLRGLLSIHLAIRSSNFEVRTSKSDMQIDASKWSGEGTFTQVMIDHLGAVAEIVALRVEDAPASQSGADYNFISNEIFVAFATVAHTEPTRRFGFIPGSRTVTAKAMTLVALEAVLAALPGIGAPDYSDEGMLQYLRTERIIPPYQTRGYKLVELVRLYEIGTASRA